jgi:hypothetical protein
MNQADIQLWQGQERHWRINNQAEALVAFNRWKAYYHASHSEDDEGNPMTVPEPSFEAFLAGWGMGTTALVERF